MVYQSDDLTGHRFGDWTVIERTSDRKYVIKCKCGHTRERHSCYIGKVESCRKCAMPKIQEFRKRGFKY